MRGFTAIIFSAILFGLAAFPVFAADQSVVEVVAARSGATYSLYDKLDQLRAGSRIPVNSVIHTDASGEATIKFFDGTLLEIEPDSEVFLIDFADNPKDEVAIFSLNSGVATLKPGNPEKRRERPLVVHTPQAKVDAGAASLILQARDGKNHIYVDSMANRGVVVHDKIHGDELEILQTGEIATIAPEGAGECTASSCILKRAKVKKPGS